MWDMQEALLKQWGLLEKVKLVTFEKDAVEAIKQAWPLEAACSVFVTKLGDDTVSKLAQLGWTTLMAGNFFKLMFLYMMIP